jgi:hypothetical protein
VIARRQARLSADCNAALIAEDEVRAEQFAFVRKPTKMPPKIDQRRLFAHRERALPLLLGHWQRAFGLGCKK